MNAKLPSPDEVWAARTAAGGWNGAFHGRRRRDGEALEARWLVSGDRVKTPIIEFPAAVDAEVWTDCGCDLNPGTGRRAFTRNAPPARPLARPSAAPFPPCGDIRRPGRRASGAAMAFRVSEK